MLVALFGSIARSLRVYGRWLAPIGRAALSVLSVSLIVARPARALSGGNLSGTVSLVNTILTNGSPDNCASSNTAH